MPSGPQATPYEPPHYTNVIDGAPLHLTGPAFPAGYRFIHHVELTMESGPDESVQHMFTLIISAAANGNTRKAEDGSAGISADVSFDDVRVELHSGGQQLFFDSGQPLEVAGQPLAAFVAAQRAARFRILVAPDGQVNIVDGFEEFRKKVISALGGETSPLAPFLASALDKAAFSRMIQLVVPLEEPGRVLQQGESWKTSHIDGSGSDAGTRSHANQFVRWDLYRNHRAAQIEVTSDGAGGGGSGHIWFDPEIGMTVKSDLTFAPSSAAGATATLDLPSSGSAPMRRHLSSWLLGEELQ